MKRILLTGMSGTGKSTVIDELKARGYNAVDVDEPGWSEHGPAGDWIWNEDRVQALLSREDGEVLFVSGCAENQVKFYSQLNHIVLLSAPVDVILERLSTRANNQFGKDPGELTNILLDVATVEPFLRRGASHEIDTSAPLNEVVSEVLRNAGE